MFFVTLRREVETNLLLPRHHVNIFRRWVVSYRNPPAEYRRRRRTAEYDTVSSEMLVEKLLLWRAAELAVAILLLLSSAFPQQTHDLNLPILYLIQTYDWLQLTAPAVVSRIQ